MGEIADVLAAYGLRVEPDTPGNLDARVIELVERCEALRTRLERAEGALREVESWLWDFYRWDEVPQEFRSQIAWVAERAHPALEKTTC